MPSDGQPAKVDFARKPSHARPHGVLRFTPPPQVEVERVKVFSLGERWTPGRVKRGRLGQLSGRRLVRADLATEPLNK